MTRRSSGPGSGRWSNSAPDLEVVGEASDGRRALELARNARADVVLMDVRMPDLDGLAGDPAHLRR